MGTLITYLRILIIDIHSHNHTDSFFFHLSLLLALSSYSLLIQLFLLFLLLTPLLTGIHDIQSTGEGIDTPDEGTGDEMESATDASENGVSQPVRKRSGN